MAKSVIEIQGNKKKRSYGTQSSRKKTSIGYSANSRPLNKHKKRSTKKYRGQGR